MTPSPLTERAIRVACDADRVIYGPFLQMTRADVAVGQDIAPTLHGYRATFDLWEAVAWPR